MARPLLTLSFCSGKIRLLVHWWTLISYNRRIKLSVGVASRLKGHKSTRVKSLVCCIFFAYFSGLLVGYLTFRELDRCKGRFNLVIFYVHRFIRLFIPLALIIAFAIAFMPSLGHTMNSQQLIGMLDEQANKCRQVFFLMHGIKCPTHGLLTEKLICFVLAQRN